MDLQYVGKQNNNISETIDPLQLNIILNNNRGKLSYDDKIFYFEDESSLLSCFKLFNENYTNNLYFMQNASVVINRNNEILKSRKTLEQNIDSFMYCKE